MSLCINQNIDKTSLKQSQSLDYIYKANSSKEVEIILSEQIDIYRCFVKDTNKLFIKQKKIINEESYACLYLINACLISSNIDDKTYHQDLSKIQTSNNLDELYQIYIKYIKLAADGINKLDEKRIFSRSEISKLSSIYNLLFYILFFIQCCGLIIGIILIAFSYKDN
jgi:hypothetical protein